MKYLIFSLALFTSISCTNTSGVAQSDTLEERVDGYIGDMMEQFDVKGAIAIGIVNGNETLLEKTYGYADAERQLPANTRTPFYIASVTKSFVGTLCALLDEKELIDLHEPLETAIPFDLSDNINLEDVQFIDLLTHTSGIKNYSVPFKTAYSGGFSKEELLHDFRNASYQTTQGYEYSNLGYIIAGMILEERFGESWKDLLVQHLFDPIGMKNTSASVSDYNTDSLARPYSFDFTKGQSNRLEVMDVRTLAFPKSDDVMHAAGGLITTIEDMNKWMKFHLTGTPPIISERTLDSIHTDLVGLYENHGPLNGYGYGIGWLQSDWGEYALTSHSGGYSGYISICVLNRESGVGITILSNQLNPVIYPLLSYLLGQLLDRSDLEAHLNAETAKRLGSWNRYKHQLDSISSISEKNIIDRRPFPNYTGQYSNENFGVVSVRENQNKLIIDMGNLQFSGKYLGDDTFFIISETHLFTEKAIFKFNDDENNADQVIIEGVEFQRFKNEEG